MAAGRKKKKGLIIVLVIVGVLVLGFILLALAAPASIASNLAEEEAQRRTIESYYAFSGNIAAENGVSIAGEVSQKVLSVNFKEGDSVKTGDIIAVLDSSKIEESIEKLKINMTSSELNDNYNILSARHNYEDYRDGIANNTNTQLLSAQAQVDNAKRALDTAEEDYEDAKKKFENGDDSQLLSAKTTVEQAERKLKSAKNDYDDYLVECEQDNNSSLRAAEQQVEAAKRRYDSAYDAYNDYRVDLSYNDVESIIQAKEAAESAKEAYNSAKKAYDDAAGEFEYIIKVPKEEAAAAAEALQKAEADYDAKIDVLTVGNDELKALKAALDAARTGYEGAKDYDRAEKKQALLDANTALLGGIEAARGSGDADYAELAGLSADYISAFNDNEAKQGALAAVIEPLDEPLSKLYKAYEAARKQLSSAERAVKNAETAADKQLDSLRDTMLTAKDSYDSAVRSLEDAQKSVSKTLNNYYEIYLTAQENLDSAKRNLSDTQTRIEKNVSTTKKTLDNAKRSYDDALKSQQAAKLSVDQTLRSYKDNYDKVLQLTALSTSVYDMNNLLEQLDGCTIKATADGTISRISLKEGEYAAAGQTAVVITDYSKLKITVKIDEYDIAKANEGDEVEIYINAADKSFKGIIDKISPEAEISGGVSYFKSDISFTGEQVRPGMSAEVRLIRNRAVNAVSISADAVRTDDANRAYVTVKNADGKYEDRFVTVGVSNGTYVEIKEGLFENETVYYPQKQYSIMEGLMGGRDE